MLRAIIPWALPGHSIWLAPLLLGFLAVNGLTRAVLALMNSESIVASPFSTLLSFAIGFLFDLTVLSLGASGFIAAFCLLPPGRLRLMRWAIRLVSMPVALCLSFTAISEILFWNEFSTRFNFIAVDYLVFRTEVIGNIRESYNLSTIFGVLALLAALLWFFFLFQSKRIQTGQQDLRHRLTAATLWPLIATGLLLASNASWKQFSSDSRINELAGNGYYDFVHAFFHNEIDYEQFYATREIADPKAFQHEVQAEKPPRKRHVLLVSVESLSAAFLGSYGATSNLTPYLDAFSEESLRFTQFYATGTRTVRGLEAISMGIVPTPGHAIVRRPAAQGLQTLGQILSDHGWQSVYLYGGYSYFDSMKDFFGRNGYEVVDRQVLRPEQISHETIWGVADEDLFAQSLREMERRANKGQPVFMHIMTTSNHRPFTYPEGRIDIPSKTGREGAVKYSDYAIGKWLEAVKKQPWYRDSIIVILADHTHLGRGKAELPPSNYHIPLFIHAPGLITPGTFDAISSQIDIAPTLLGLLRLPYSSRFFGQDAFKDGTRNQRAYFANQQTVGLYKDGKVVELYPNRNIRVVDAKTNAVLDPTDHAQEVLIEEAIRSYQNASFAFKNGLLKRPLPEASKP